MEQSKTRAENVNQVLPKKDKKLPGACQLQLPLRTLAWGDSEAPDSKSFIPFPEASAEEEELVLLNQCLPLP